MKPSLFGLEQSNHDFSLARSWGKNIFNNAFPISLAIYMDYLGLRPVYLLLDEQLTIQHGKIPVQELFGIAPRYEFLFFNFEADFPPYRPLATGNIPRSDIVLSNSQTDESLSFLEIKLTALPDNSTYHLQEDSFGCEVVVRPDTIVYLGLGIAKAFQHQRTLLKEELSTFPFIQDWSDIELVAPQIAGLANTLDNFLKKYLHLQRPLVLQPIWKTIGKQLLLAEDAFDIFVWSDFAFTRLFFREAKENQSKLSRGARSVAWLAKLLLDFAETGKVNHKALIDKMSFNTKNDKAFAANGRVTHTYMKSPELLKPRIKREAIREIILGGGENLLSPERRLDAAILSTPNLFD